MYSVDDVIKHIQHTSTPNLSLNEYMIYTYQYLFEKKISRLLYEECMEHYMLDEIPTITNNQKCNQLLSFDEVIQIHQKMGVNKHTSYYDFLRIKEILTLQGKFTNENISLQIKLFEQTHKGQRQAKNIKEVAKYIQQLKGYNFLEHGLPSSVSPEQFIHHCSYTTDNEYLWYDSLKELGL